MSLDQEALSARKARWRGCAHEDLQFGSGGHFIFCCQCGAEWVASHDGGKIDFERAGNVVSNFDHRIAGVPLINV